MPGLLQYLDKKNKDDKDNTKGLLSIYGGILPPIPTKESPDYDIEGFIAKYGEPDQSNGQHLTDEFKLPNHITFSEQSRYSSPNMKGGKWEKGGQDLWSFMPSEFNLKNYTPEELADYFSNYERRGTGVMLPDGRFIQGNL